ncbi:hypothetical protein Sjap_006186 [Stephania japonica]|uniref:Uncharacterized protein n=1 Tax=Stephania japonica TaxID=461633 RepID=A0AAP0K6X3_9MAGN
MVRPETERRTEERRERRREQRTEKVASPQQRLGEIPKTFTGGGSAGSTAGSGVAEPGTPEVAVNRSTPPRDAHHGVKHIRLNQRLGRKTSRQRRPSYFPTASSVYEQTKAMAEMHRAPAARSHIASNAVPTPHFTKSSRCPRGVLHIGEIRRDYARYESRGKAIRDEERHLNTGVVAGVAAGCRGRSWVGPPGPPEVINPRSVAGIVSPHGDRPRNCVVLPGLLLSRAAAPVQDALIGVLHPPPPLSCAAAPWGVSHTSPPLPSSPPCNLVGVRRRFSISPAHLALVDQRAGKRPPFFFNQGHGPWCVNGGSRSFPTAAPPPPWAHIYAPP